MPLFRVTIRYGQRSHRYHVRDIEAESLGMAIARVAETFPEEVGAGGDLVEIRLQADPAGREYVPG
jgi:hypothetical protein